MKKSIYAVCTLDGALLHQATKSLELGASTVSCSFLARQESVNLALPITAVTERNRLFGSFASPVERTVTIQ